MVTVIALLVVSSFDCESGIGNPCVATAGDGYCGGAGDVGSGGGDEIWPSVRVRLLQNCLFASPSCAWGQGAVLGTSCQSRAGHKNQGWFICL